MGQPYEIKPLSSYARCTGPPASVRAAHHRRGDRDDTARSGACCPLSRQSLISSLSLPALQGRRPGLTRGRPEDRFTSHMAACSHLQRFIAEDTLHPATRLRYG